MVLQGVAMASSAARPYGHVAVTMVEGPLAPPPRQVSETSLKIVFIKRMQTNVCFTMQPSAGPCNVPIGALPSLA